MSWSIVALGASAQATAGNLTLNEPTGAAQNDLLVACIAYRASAIFTLPAGWVTAAPQQNSGDTDATSGIASGLMAYIVRGGSAPSYSFTRTVGDIAKGRVIAYRGGNTASIYASGAAATRGTIGEPTLGSISATANNLLVSMVSHGDNSLTATMDAVTDPGTASNGTDTTTNPTVGTWLERTDVADNAGADVGLFIADAVKTSTGTTGTFSADAATTTRSVMIVGAFNMAAANNYVPVLEQADGWRVATGSTANTNYVPALEQTSGWRVTGGVSTVVLDIDPDGIWTPWSVHEVGEETYSASLVGTGTDYVPDILPEPYWIDTSSDRSLGVGWLGQVAASIAVAATVAFSPVPDTGAAAFFDSGSSYAAHYRITGDASGAFSASSEKVLVFNIEGEPYGILSVGEGTYSAQLVGANDYIPDLAWADLYVAAASNASADRQYEGISVGSFVAQADSFGSGYFAGTAAEKFFSAPTVKGEGYYAGTSVERFSVGEGTYSASLSIQTIVLEGDVRWKLTGGVSSVVLDIDPAGIWTPWATYEVGEGTSTWSPDIADDIEEEGHAAIRFLHPSWHTFSMVRSMDVLWSKFESATEHSSNLKKDINYTGDSAGAFSSGTEHVFVGKLTIVRDGISAIKIDASHERVTERSYAGTTAEAFSVGENTYTANVSVQNIVPEVGANVFLSSDFGLAHRISQAKEEGHAAWICTGGVSSIILDVNPVPSPGYDLWAAASDLFVSTHVNANVTGDVAASFTSGTEVMIVLLAGQIAIAGDAAFSFAAAHDKDISPVIGATATLSATHTKDISPVTISVASFAAAADYWKGLHNEILVGDARFYLDRLPQDGAWTDETQDGASTEPVQDGAWTEARYDYRLADYSVGFAPSSVADEIFSAAHEVSVSEGAVLTAEFVGDVAGTFALSTDLRVSKIPEVSTAIIFGVEGTVVYTFVPPVVVGPYTTTWVCPPKPTRGTSQDGAWTELDQDGAWVENVGFAMSEGSEWGAYTQDDAYPYTYLRKPNVYDLTESKVSLTATTEGLPTIPEVLEGKITTVTTDESEPTSSI